MYKKKIRKFSNFKNYGAPPEIFSWRPPCRNSKAMQVQNIKILRNIFLAEYNILTTQLYTDSISKRNNFSSFDCIVVFQHIYFTSNFENKF